MYRNEEIGKRIREQFDDQVAYYAILAVESEELLNNFAIKTTGKPLSFPIDYEAFANWLGFSVEYEDLNYFSIGLLRVGSEFSAKDEKNKVIKVEKELPFTEAKYYIIKALSGYLFEGKKCNRYFNDVLVTNASGGNKFLKEDELATFLTLPPSLTFEKINDYVENIILKRHGNEFVTQEFRILLADSTNISYQYITESFERFRKFASHVGYARYREELFEKIDELSPNSDNEKVKRMINRYKTPKFM